jgi:phage terminase large subunit-like protein
VSDTAETTRNKLMKTLLYGEEYELGSGLIPADLIGRIAKPSGHIETVLVRHVTKGWSELGFKAYEQKRKSFQSVERHVILLDEEPQDIGIYSECVTRTATFNGLVMLTFTALCGVTPLVLKFMPELAGLKPDTESRARAVVICGWDDIPHLTPAQQKELEAEYQPHEIPARTKGIPDVSIGAVYPIPESVIKIDPFPIPDHWPRCFALDPGWEDPTAALWTAWDRETDIIYFYSEHYQKMKEPPIHASAIKARGAWIPGTGDYATDIKDGRSTLDVYRDEGLNITRCQKSDKDARVMDLLTRFSTGRARVFSTLTNFFMEYRMYHRDEKGNFCGPDHLMNCAEYTVQSGLKLAKTNIEANLDGADRPMWEKSFGL